MSLQDKNILITPNIGSSTDDPKIVFSGADATTGAQNITLKAYPTSNGTLSFEGSAGQLFSITNSLTGTIYSVNDVSGIPSIEVLDTGLIKLAPYNGLVSIGPAAVFISATFTTSSTSQVTIDSFSSTSYRSAKYIIQMTSGTAYHLTEISMIHDGTTVRITQYGDVRTGASLGSFDASISAGNLNLQFTPTNASTTVKLSRTVIGI